MSINCKACGEELSEEYGGKLSPDTKCPECGEPLHRNITLHTSGAIFGSSGATATMTVYTYPEMLITEAKALIKRNKYPLAPVIAHMACEISVERGFARAFEKKGLGDIEEAVTKLLPSRSITNERVRKLYDALTGRNTYQDLQHIWEPLRELANLRNKAVHNGHICSEQEAEAAIETAIEFVRYFKKFIV